MIGTIPAITATPPEMAVLVVVGALIGAGAIYAFERLHKSSVLHRAEDILREAREESEQFKRQAELEAKEDLFRNREAMEKEIQESRHDLREFEKRLNKREENLERKIDLLNKKERYIENLERSLAERRKELNDGKAEIERLQEQEKINLHKISGMNRDEAAAELLRRLEKALERECAELVSRRLTEARENAEQQARKILGIAIQRYAADHCAETVVATVELPNDQMKGRIIGREGRNIRAFEKSTGVDVIVDDTPGVVVVSGFDGVRREIARRSMEKLVQDGRIHPARIEQIVEQTSKEMMEHLKEVGKQAGFDVGIHDLHPREIELLGRLKYRTSYGQNVLLHAMEVAHLAGVMAAELGLEVGIAKRCGLLHDIGKAVDHEIEGGHPEIGADVLKRCGEKPEVIDAALSHHEDVRPEYIYTVLVAAADAVSAARPGARRETLEKYIKRLERLEEIAGAFSGVDTAYAIQAGREVRVMVASDRVDDKMAAKICRDIAKEIEDEMTYPGEVKVTLIRESRFVEKAK